MTELRPIPDWPGYLAGDDGVIYSTRGRWRQPDDAPRRLTPGRQTNGYLMVNLVRLDGSKLSQRVHRLVCAAWHGPCPPGAECSHLNDDKEDNTPSNLRWESPLANQRRRRGNGIDDAGHRNSRASLSEAQVAEVRELLVCSRYTHQEIADRFGVRRLTITRINTGERYPR